MNQNGRTKANVTRLAAKHVERYGRGVALALRGEPTYSLKDSVKYLLIWIGIVESNCEYERCTPEQQVEIDDALESGE